MYCKMMKRISGNSTVNINKASQAELETLPGIGPSIASRIIEYRESKGKFSKIEDIKNVTGIGDNKFANIKDFIRVK
ncbi:MAG: helix-hairpin-helix domain-containing protein [Clostridia bacterium]|nr:helix-hairpin-helix domain-containing protein [Clostridia bacterium]